MTPDSSSLWATPSLPPLVQDLWFSAGAGSSPLRQPTTPRAGRQPKDADAAQSRRKEGVYTSVGVFLCQDKGWVWWWTDKKRVKGVTRWGTGEQRAASPVLKQDRIWSGCLAGVWNGSTLGLKLGEKCTNTVWAITLYHLSFSPRFYVVVFFYSFGPTSKQKEL